jgi:hypothetical protein
MKRNGGVLAVAVALLIFAVGERIGVPPAEAGTQDFQLNQIESTLRSIENRLGRIESSALSRETFDPSAGRLNRLESELSSLAGLGADLSRLETRLASLASAGAQLARIETRLAAIEADVGVILDEVCSESDDC